jgi:hypothetical protein
MHTVHLHDVFVFGAQKLLAFAHRRMRILRVVHKFNGYKPLLQDILALVNCTKSTFAQLTHQLKVNFQKQRRSIIVKRRKRWRVWQ